MDIFLLIPSYITVFLTYILITGVKSLECYSCVYIPNVDSQKSCSDPWSWYRDKFNVFSGPPKRECAHACMKIVIEHPGEYPTVVRTCGKPCNETKSGSTITSCCQTELCNGTDSHHIYSGKLLILFTALLSFAITLR